jgi:hypothetical protein
VTANRRDNVLKWVAMVLLVLLFIAGVSFWRGGTAILVLNETGCDLNVLRVVMPGFECVFQNVPNRTSASCFGHARGDGLIALSLQGGECGDRQIGTEEYVNPLFGWQGILLLRSDGTLGVTELPR